MQAHKVLAALIACFAATWAVQAQAALVKPMCAPQPLWLAFQKKHIQQDGRVIDYQVSPGISTSEGQAYALFFALVENDPATFNTLLKWTQQHLAQGDLSQHLPAWRWGQIAGNDWGVLEANSAADADIWLAYTLLEAGRLWLNPQYNSLGLQLLRQIVAKEVVSVPNLGPMLMAGQHGFKIADQRWLFNSSYYPIQLLKRIALADPIGPWQAVTNNAVGLLMAVSQYGYAPDWSVFHELQGWTYLPEKGAIGSYDAIRVYLWIGMMSDQDPLKKTLLNHYSGMLNSLAQGRTSPPERVDTLTGMATGEGPAGYSAALLPYLQSQQKSALLARQKELIARKSNAPLIGEQQHYYDQVLGLFGLGWQAQKFRFNAQGYLMPSWSTSCKPALQKRTQ